MKCPYCDYVAEDGNAWQEIAHMQLEHIDVLRERMKSFGEEFETGFGSFDHLTEQVAEAASSIVKQQRVEAEEREAIWLERLRKADERADRFRDENLRLQQRIRELESEMSKDG